MGIAIFADSCCDLTPALASLLEVERVSFQIDVNGQHFVDDPSLDIKSLLAAMHAYSGPATTACPSPEDFAVKMRSAQECFVITISSKLSGCHNAAVVARDMVLEESPEKRIHIFDSESAAAGETLLALRLHQDIVAGMTFDEIVEKETAFIETMRTRFVLDDLKNLVKNGRLSKVAGMLGTMLNIRPLLADDGHGEIVALEKARGVQKALARLVEIVAESTRSAAEKSVVLVMTYCNCPDRAAHLKEALLERCPALLEVWTVPTGGLSSVYANDGGVVLAF